MAKQIDENYQEIFYSIVIRLKGAHRLIKFAEHYHYITMTEVKPVEGWIMVYKYATYDYHNMDKITWYLAGDLEDHVIGLLKQSFEKNPHTLREQFTSYMLRSQN